MKTKLLLLLMVFPLISQAQTAIELYYGYINDDPATTDGTGSRNYNRLYPGGPLEQSASGADQVWNFAPFTATGPSTYHNALPTSGEMTTYPNTSIVTTNTFTTGAVTSTSKAYFANAASSSIALTGIETEEFSLNYNTNNAVIGPFPMYYGDSSLDNTGGTFQYQAYSGTFSGTIYSNVDAYGTLSLENTGFDPQTVAVTRLKTIQNMSLSTIIPNVGTATITTYQYYRENDLFPLFTSAVTHITVPLLAIDQTIELYEAANPAFLETNEFSMNSKVSIAPNPASHEISINIADGTPLTKLHITDINGKTVIESTQQTIDISQLHTGVYFAEIETANGKAIKKVIKQ